VRVDIDCGVQVEGKIENSERNQELNQQGDLSDLLIDELDVAAQQVVLNRDSHDGAAQVSAGIRAKKPIEKKELSE
jgi:hypothetical protein